MLENIREKAERGVLSSWVPSIMNLVSLVQLGGLGSAWCAAGRVKFAARADFSAAATELHIVPGKAHLNPLGTV